MQSAQPFSYLRTDSPAGIPGNSPRPPHHAPHAGFLRTPEYRQPTVKLSAPNDRDEVLRRNIHRELETRMGLVGGGGHGVQGGLVEEDVGGGGNRLERDGRKRKRVDDRAVEGKTRRHVERGGADRLIRDLADYDHPRIRVKVHGLPPPAPVVGHSPPDGHVFYTGASLTPHNRPSDADSGCHSDLSEALLLPLPPKDKRRNMARAKKTSKRRVSKQSPQGFPKDHSQGFSKEYPQGFSIQNPQGFTKEHPEGFTKEYSQGYPKEHPHGYSKDPRPDVVLRPVSIEHPGIFDNFVLKGRRDVEREQDGGINVSNVLPVRKQSTANQPNYSSGDYLEPSPHVAKPSNGDHGNGKDNARRLNNGNHSNGIDQTVVTSGVPNDIPVFVSVPFRGSSASVISGSRFGGSQDSIVVPGGQDRSRTTRCCYGNVVTMVIVLVLVLLIGCAVGFIAGWFGRQSALT